MNKWDIWKRYLWFIFMVGGITCLAFDVIPDLMTHNFHSLPDLFLVIFWIFISFIKWIERSVNERFIKIGLIITIIPFVAHIVTGIILEGLKEKYLIMLFSLILLAILAIPAKIWERYFKDKQESPSDVPEER